jgi:hypothetical protein
VNDIRKQIRKDSNKILDDLQVRGVITVYDKDGNVKARLDITRIEEEESDADSIDTEEHAG